MAEPQLSDEELERLEASTEHYTQRLTSWHMERDRLGDDHPTTVEKLLAVNELELEHFLLVNFCLPKLISDLKAGREELNRAREVIKTVHDELCWIDAYQRDTTMWGAIKKVQAALADSAEKAAAP